MKQVTFIRHAKVDMDSSKPVTAKMLKSWEEAYNTAPIINDTPLNETLHETFKEVDYIICSTLRRSHDSVNLLGARADESNALFNEAQIPSLDGTWLKLKPTNWLVLFRMLSLVGVGRWAMTLKETKMQSKKAAKRLVELSDEHDHILLMGHGVMNWLIRKELLASGWQNEGKDVHVNWGMTHLVKPSISSGLSKSL